MFLKTTAFDELRLPITVTNGYVALIEFDIPWKSLSSSPILIRIKELSVLLGPNIQSESLSGIILLLFI